jgi:hypothetical protein
MGIAALFAKVCDAFQVLTGRAKSPATAATPPNKVAALLPHFDYVIEVEATPATENINPGEFYYVAYRGTAYWVMFRCPCGCGEVLSLSLQTAHYPYWRIQYSKKGRPTLYPSVWRNTGCKSHFWIDDGIVTWCTNSGIAPHIARPDMYKSR